MYSPVKCSREFIKQIAFKTNHHTRIGKVKGVTALNNLLDASTEMFRNIYSERESERMIACATLLVSVTELVKNKPGASAVQSAYSVLPLLGLLGLATVGESKDEILRTTGLSDDDAIKAVFPVVETRLRSIKGVELKTATKVYIPIGYELDDNFAATARNTFGSEVKNVDFTKSGETAKEINDWVEDQTNHRIKDLVDPNTLDQDTRAVLVNALYFKGSWKQKFDSRYTVERDFHVTKDNTVKLPFMFQKNDFEYYESQDLDAKFLKLPYEGEEASFVIVLPNQIDGLEALEKNLTPEAFNNAMSNLRKVEVNVHIPKFKIETTTDLKAALSNIGINALFDPSKARIDKLLKESKNLFVSNAVQKAFLEVNEEGAEAAAANEFGVRGYSLITPELVFNADHPFVLALLQGKTTLFDGIFRA